MSLLYTQAPTGYFNEYLYDHYLGANMMAVDRTQHYKMTDWDIAVVNPITAPFQPIAEDYLQYYLLQACNDSAKRFKDSSKPNFICWSGGIDSTLVLYALLANDVKFQVICNDKAITEHPEAFADLVKRGVKFVTPGDLSSLMPIANIITGDLGDHISTAHNNAWIHRYDIDPYGDADKEFKKVTRMWGRLSDLPKDAHKRYITMYRETAAFAGVKVDTWNRMLWWNTFNFKWQPGKYRFFNNTAFGHPNMAPAVPYISFFDTDMFQRWAVSNNNADYDEPDERIKKMPYQRATVTLGGSVPENKQKIPSQVHLWVGRNRPYALDLTDEGQVVPIYSLAELAKFADTSHR